MYLLPFFTADSIFPLRFLFPSFSTFYCSFFVKVNAYLLEKFLNFLSFHKFSELFWNFLNFLAKLLESVWKQKNAACFTHLFCWLNFPAKWSKKNCFKPIKYFIYATCFIICQDLFDPLDLGLIHEGIWLWIFKMLT